MRSHPSSTRPSGSERDRLAALGYVVRERIFGSAELERLRDDCERLVARLNAADLASLLGW